MSIDVLTCKVIWVPVIGTEHQHIGVFVYQRCQSFKIPGSGTFTYLYLHSFFYLLQSLLIRKGFMVRCNSRINILLQIFTPKPGSMAVYLLSKCFGDPDLGKHIGIVIDHTGKIHHFGKVLDLRHLQQVLYLFGSKCRTVGLESGGRYAGRSTEIEFER